MAVVDVGQEGPAGQDVTTDARRLIVISGNKWVEGQVKGRKGELFFRIPAAGKIDISQSPDFKKVWYSRYELDGDTLKTLHLLDAGEKPEDRPKEVKATGSNKTAGRGWVFIWKRVKP
jgi:hypothetical protein